MSFIGLVLVAAGIWKWLTRKRISTEPSGLRFQGRVLAGYAIGSVAAYWLLERLDGAVQWAAYSGWTSP